MIKAEVDRDDEAVMRTVDAAIAKITANQHVRHLRGAAGRADDHEQPAHLYPAGWSEEHVAIEPDESIHRGGCRVLTETGMIDATIETQLRMLQGHRGRNRG